MSEKSPVRALLDERRAELMERLEGLERAERCEGIVMTAARDVALIRDELAFLVELGRRLVAEADERIAVRNVERAARVLRGERWNPVSSDGVD